jgi:hypothetical protein
VGVEKCGSRSLLGFLRLYSSVSMTRNQLSFPLVKAQIDPFTNFFFPLELCMPSIDFFSALRKVFTKAEKGKKTPVVDARITKVRHLLVKSRALQHTSG